MNSTTDSAHDQKKKKKETQNKLTAACSMTGMLMERKLWLILEGYFYKKKIISVE